MKNKILYFYNKHNVTINIISWLIGVFGLGFGWYSWKNPVGIDPELTVIIQTNDNYLVRTGKKIEDLNISYKNVDFLSDSLNLLVKQIRIKNFGKGVVREIDYSSTPFQLKVTNGKFIAVEVPPKKWNDYLIDNLNPKIKDSNTISLEKLVFNSNDEVILNVYLLTSDKKEPYFYATGNIAGQGLVRYIKEENISTETDWLGLFEVLFWLAVAIFAIILVLSGMGIVYDFIITRIRKNIVLNKSEYVYKKGLDNNQIAIVEAYSALGKKDFLGLIDTLCTPDLIQNEESIINSYKTVKQFSKIEREYSSGYYLFSEYLKKRGLLVENEGKYNITSDFKDEIEKVLQKLKS